MARPQSAFGAKRTWTGRQNWMDRLKMTQNGRGACVAVRPHAGPLDRADKRPEYIFFALALRTNGIHIVYEACKRGRAVKTKAFAIVMMTCVMLFAPIRAWASPVETFTLEGVSYSSFFYESGTLSGTFDYNGAFSNISITATYGFVNGDVFNVDDGSTATELKATSSNGDVLDLTFAAALPASGGGTVGVTGNYVESFGAFETYSGCSLYFALCAEFIADAGEVTTTPLPAAAPLFAAGLGALGLIATRRKRKNAAAFAAA
jgi:hypothetical protein